MSRTHATIAAETGAPMRGEPARAARTRGGPKFFVSCLTGAFSKLGRSLRSVATRLASLSTQIARNSSSASVMARVIRWSEGVRGGRGRTPKALRMEAWDLWSRVAALERPKAATTKLARQQRHNP